eukprot:CAMPEP_0113504056 /NCGR_PEP_ID=MMETSP0014_2-20120614/34513_1 /TAXON_ID=2857 /ORGANISM="Nitzschia sp." /LENGTH=290 /DNA_ID=CAMNT_0000399143 /DNA_START=619 /DNA_END=1491 /DNA_ORIENTATION=- /assembly_acc=CAM_ASM_000159
MTRNLDSTPLSSVSVTRLPAALVLVMSLTAFASQVSTVTAQGNSCYICPANVRRLEDDATNNGGLRGLQGTPTLAQMVATINNPNKIVPNFADGKSTCAYLQETVQDVKSDGADGAWCFNNVWLACIAGCCGDTSSCFGEYVDPNPACDLCGTPPGEVANDFQGVPAVNTGRTTNTYMGIGLSCEGLYDASADLALFPASECSTVQRTAGRACCNLPEKAIHATGNLPIPERFTNGSGGKRAPLPQQAPPPVPAPAPQPVGPPPSTPGNGLPQFNSGGPCGEAAYKVYVP